MTALKLFEDFGAATPAEPEEEATDEALEDEKLRSFEQGYGAGWDDAVKAQKEAGQLLADTVQAVVADARITRDEAFAAFLEAAVPLIDALFESVLPDMAARSFPAHVVQVVENALKSVADRPVEIRVAPDQIKPVRRVLADVSDDVVLREDPALAPGQCMLALGEQEQRIDLPAVLEELRKALETFKFSIDEEA